MLLEYKLNPVKINIEMPENKLSKTLSLGINKTTFLRIKNLYKDYK